MDYIVKSIFIEENNKEYPILIGRNANGNELIIKISHPESLWMHLNNISSAHIILQNEGEKIPKKYINQVAKMLFEYKSNVPKNVSVIYTELKNIKLTDTLGCVLTKNTKKIKFN